MLDKETAASLETLKAALAAIQCFKDQLQLSLSAIRNSLPATDAIRNLEEARKTVFAVYEDQHPHLMEVEIRSLHRAKGLALRACEVVTASLTGKDCAAKIEEPSRRKLSRLRRELTDVQGTLRDSRIDRLIQLSAVEHLS